MEQAIYLESYEKEIDHISAHIEKLVGPVNATLTDESPEDIITILIVKPTKKNNFYTLVVYGKVKKSMGPENNDKNNPNVSFTINLPIDWPLPLSEEDLKKANSQAMFPINLLMNIMRYHLHHQKLSCGHTITGSPEPER